MNHDGLPLDFSNWSDAYQEHGILAPGENILGAAPGGGSVAQSGTSFATALVSGAAGLLMSLQLRHTGKTDSQAIRQAILQSAISCDQHPVADCRRLLSGRLNLPAAVSRLSLGAVNIMSEPQNPTESAASNRVERFLENGAATDQIAQQEAAPVMPPTQSPSPRIEALSPPPAPAPEAPPKSEAKSSCGCGSGCGSASKAPNTVYTLGQIAFDFGTEARRDSFIQQGVQHPGNPIELLEHLDENPWAASAVTWILVQETTPVYAIRPAGAFAEEAFSRLRTFMRGQIEEGISQVSLGGIEAGTATLLNGQEVPLIVPDIRSMFSWSTPALIEAVLGPRPENGQDDSCYDEQAEEVSNFLDRVYYEISNLGVAPQERAINYAATNAYQVATVYRDAIKQSLKLDNIGVERSSVCRPGSDCWDVRLTFFDPSQRHEKAKEVYRFTVDVSERVPVTVGKVRRWSAY
jgi:cyanobactin maturation PatA/PatG family protease